ncbi:MAG: hypothetical protein QME49_10215 [bacterium]|nr:hypothetical protein [bacterium]
MKPFWQLLYPCVFFIIPLSPTIVTLEHPNLSATFLTCKQNVSVSCVFPLNTSVETGSPNSSHNNPITICFFPFFLSRLYP